MRNLLFALCCAGCGITTATTQINEPPHTMNPRSDDALEVTTTPPTRPHVDVALIDIGAGKRGNTDAELFGALRARALEMGCDAVVLVGFLGRARLESLVGTCVAYVQPPVPVH